ncbi:MAG: GDSL-type esterase/lipase family protein [Melioribacter sp.]|nr:GDSL-type esterase/lipase family protein [Melioribacter sp.]
MKKSVLNVTHENNLSPIKHKLFWLITLLFPIILLILTEVILRFINYGGNLDLFIDGPEGYENYLRCNPNVARRYFTFQSIVPSPPKQLMLRIKPSNGIRIFVIGESSTAGFPYGNNVSFPMYLQRMLKKTFPDKEIEVINISMSAINSYALLDLVDEIVEYEPDVLLIYTGHNEYYGALGVGSTQSIGNLRWFIRAYLYLEKFRTFLLIRDIISWIKIKFQELFNKSTIENLPGTLMEEVVAEQIIPYKSLLYEQGKQQFKENIERIIKIAKSKNIKVVISELVSNLKDQKPFISVDSKYGRADSCFQKAQYYESVGNYIKAKEYYIKSKDLDALRFRAPEEFNDIIHSLGKKYNIAFVPLVKYFEKESPNELIGNNLMLEHLHPNKDGYFLIAKAFYNTLKENKIISTQWNIINIDEEKKNGFTELDSVYADLSVKRLKSSWPFTPKNRPNDFFTEFKPTNILEKLSLKILQDPEYSIETAHMDLGKYYEQKGELDKALLEYYALINSIPQEVEFQINAATVLIKMKKYDEAYELLKNSLTYKKTSFAYKWLGQIELLRNNYSQAIYYLRKADMQDSQVVFNLSRAYYYNKQIVEGDNYFYLLQSIAPKSRYYLYLSRLRNLVKNNMEIPKIEIN